MGSLINIALFGLALEKLVQKFYHFIFGCVERQCQKKLWKLWVFFWTLLSNCTYAASTKTLRYIFGAVYLPICWDL